MHTFTEIIKFGVYFLIPVAVYIIFFFLFDSKERITKIKKVFISLFISHGIAGVHTILSNNIGYDFKPSLPGPLFKFRTKAVKLLENKKNCVFCF